MPRVYRLDRLEMPKIEELEPRLRSKVMRQGARVVALEARRIAPRRSGRLAKSIKYYVRRGGLEGKVVPKNAPHAHLVHDGTKPHDIYAKTPESARRGWRFYHGSTKVAVHHPGARPHPFLVEAGERSRDDVERVMLEKAKEVLGEIA